MAAALRALPFALALVLSVIVCAGAAEPETGGAPAGGDAAAQAIHRAHAIAMFGEPKYPPGFAHFDYVNPDAPRGGTLRLGVTGTFDSFNPYVIKGNPAAAGEAETLTVASADEPFTQYGLIADEIVWPEDRSWVEFELRPEARWQDGQPITPEDVVFSLDILKTKGAPSYRFYYAAVTKAEKVGERRVRFTFNQAGNRELPLIMGQMPILPKHYWEGRDFERSTLEPPLSSGPYRITAFEPGRYVVTELDPAYWGQDLPVNVGQNNFAQIRYEYFRDETVERQALKGGAIDLRQENQAKAWALDYNVPAVRDGWLKKEAIPNERPAGMQAFVFNTRRSVFADPKVREALVYAFDFEWTNRVLFFGQYTRTESYFANSELASDGLPTGEERDLLEKFRGRVPERVFGADYRAPTTDGSGWPRANLETALGLLGEAGWHVRDMVLVNDATGEPMHFEILLVSQAFERVILPFARNLQRLGIDVSVRLVDDSQYINRMRDFDFDMAVVVWPQSESPGNEQRSYWGSEAADTPGSSNYAGIKDPVVDALIDTVISSPDRKSLVARTRALDRVLLSGFYVIPNWYSGVDRFVYWNKFSRPGETPRRGTSIGWWWLDAEKAARLEARLASADAGQIIEKGAEDTHAPGGSERGPGALTIAAIAGGLAAVGYLVVRRAMHGRTEQCR
ncbi:MAG: ABC transporter substrate-binding protein [Rhodospirillales bacterium]|nr:ABC transporter substrate-binding protein [Rhodospirillales bacterium]